MCENFGGRYSFIGCENVDWSVTAVEEEKTGTLKVVVHFHGKFFKEKNQVGRFAFEFAVERLNSHSALFLL